MLFAILKTKKLQANCNLRKIYKQFGQRNSGEQHKGRQRSDSAEPDSGDFPKSSVSHETKQESFLGKTVFRIRQKGVPPLLLPTSVLQLPRCLARTYNLTSYDTTLFELDSFKKCNCSRKNISANLICFANVGCSPTPRQHF